MNPKRMGDACGRAFAAGGKCHGDWRKYLICQVTLNDLNLDFVPPDLDFVLSGLDFVPKNLDFVPADLDFVPRQARRPYPSPRLKADPTKRAPLPRRLK
jgi:hypothetical protein